MTPEERREIQRPLDLWDTSDQGGELRGAGVLIAFCVVATCAVIAVPIWIVMHLSKG